jgi:histone H1/5
MIKEALLALDEKSGSSPYAIAKYMEEKHKQELPSNYKKILGLQLKNSAARGKLIKIKASYKLSEAGKKVTVAKPANAEKKAKPKQTTKAKPKQTTKVAPKAKAASAAAKKPETAVKKAPKRKASTKNVGPGPKKPKKSTPSKPKQPKSIKSPAAKRARKAAAK